MYVSKVFLDELETLKTIIEEHNEEWLLIYKNVVLELEAEGIEEGTHEFESEILSNDEDLFYELRNELKGIIKDYKDRIPDLIDEYTGRFLIGSKRRKFIYNKLNEVEELLKDYELREETLSYCLVKIDECIDYDRTYRENINRDKRNKRRKDIIKYKRKGLTQVETANKLSISLRTVKRYWKGEYCRCQNKEEWKIHMKNMTEYFMREIKDKR